MAVTKCSPANERKTVEIFVSVGTRESLAFYSPSFARGGLAGTFAVDVTHFYGITNIVITVQHRDENETSWADAGAFSAITGAGSSTVDITALKQILRFKYLMTGGNTYDGVHLVMQAPSWRPYG